MNSSVIQGCFPNGFRQLVAPRPAPMPPPVAQRATMPRGAAFPPPRAVVPQQQQNQPVIQRFGAGTAMRLPDAMASAANRSIGQPLQPEVRQMMESLFCTSFADVRVHVGPHVTAIGATSYTQGSNIHFAPGQYSPEHGPGRQRLAYELAHVVQQKAGRVRNPFGSGVAVLNDPRLETEAQQFARRAAAGAPRHTIQRHPIQRLAAPRRRQIQRLALSRGRVIQRLTAAEVIMGRLGGANAAITALAEELGTTVRSLTNALLDPAYDLRGAVNSGTFNANLANTLTYASCYPTAQHLFPLVRRGVNEGGTLHEAGRVLCNSGDQVRQYVTLLITNMVSAETAGRDMVYRIELAGHGFTLIGKSTLAGIYQYELIESIADTGDIVRSLEQAIRTFSCAGIHDNLSAMASDNIDTRVQGATRMGWDADALFLGRDPNHGGHIDFPNIRMKWWSAPLSQEYDDRWYAQVRERFNYLAAEIMMIEERL
jgi:hypothetical protein